MIGVDQDASSLEAAERTVAEAKLTLNSYTDFENFYDFKPTGQHEKTLNTVPDQVVSWGTALKSVRE